MKEGSDFLTAPASSTYHLNITGGLVEHSLNVYRALKLINESYKLELPSDSVVILALGHDFCKTGLYTLGKDTRSGRDKWLVEDSCPMGHGEKSVYLIEKHIRLTMEEALAIRFHMGPWEPGAMIDYPTGYAFRAALKKTRMISALFVADNIAGSIVEKTY